MSSKKALIGALFIAVSAAVSAQSSVNSPYTRYGLGETFDQVFANNAAMGGVGYALRSDLHINPMNPASYTAVDSLSFMFDTGMTLKSSNFQEGNYKSNAKNASFDYIAMQFRLHPRLGMAIGYTPFSTVGYNFDRSKNIENSEVTISNNFYGDGGMQQIFAGLGFKILDNLSVGANIAYLYGKLNYQTTATLSNGGDQTIIYNQMSVSSYNASFGLQYTQPLNKNNSLTLGLAYTLGHVLNMHDTHGEQVTDGSSYSALQTQSTEDSYGIPHSFGVGLAWKYRKNLTVEADYTLQKWEDVKYNNRTDMYQNRSKIAVGAELLPKEYGRNYFSRIRYRIGGILLNSLSENPFIQSERRMGERTEGIRDQRWIWFPSKPEHGQQRIEHHRTICPRSSFSQRIAFGEPVRTENRTDFQRTVVHEMEG